MHAFDEFTLFMESVDIKESPSTLAPLTQFRSYAGASAGQSTLIHSLDVFLGIEHRHRTEGEAHTYSSPVRLSRDGTGERNNTWNSQSSILADISDGFSEESIEKTAQSEDSDSPTSPQKGKRNFIAEMRSYMPASHRAYLDALAKNPIQLRDFVQSEVDNSELKYAYNDVILALKRFRDAHLQMVSVYIIIQVRSIQLVSLSFASCP